jgi:hypothetical protein
LLYTISIDDGIDLSILVVYISSRYFGFLFLEEHIMAAKVKAAEKVIGMVPLPVRSRVAAARRREAARVSEVQERELGQAEEV